MPRVALTLEQCWHKVPGGTAVSINELAAALAPRPGLDLVGVAARHRRPPPDDWRPPIEVRHLPLPRIALYEAWHRLRWPPVERATGPVDIVHAATWAIPPATVPLVVTIHDLAFLDDPSRVTRHGMRFFRRGLDLALEQARLVACPSEATIDECVAAGFDRSRLRCVPWGVRAEPVGAGEVERVRQAYGLTRPYVLFCGTVEPRKNLPRLLDAFRRLDRPGVELVLVGPEGWNEDLRSLLAGNGHDGKVRPLGFVPRDDLACLYNGASVFCYPSLREGFGLPVLEAMAQGTPVVTSAGTATEEVAGDAGLLVDPRDSAAIAAALEQVLDDQALRQRLDEAGRARAATFSWERAAERMASAYETVVAG